MPPIFDPNAIPFHCAKGTADRWQELQLELLADCAGGSPAEMNQYVKADDLLDRLG